MRDIFHFFPLLWGPWEWIDVFTVAVAFANATMMCWAERRT